MALGSCAGAADDSSVRRLAALVDGVTAPGGFEKGALLAGSSLDKHTTAHLDAGDTRTHSRTAMYACDLVGCGWRNVMVKRLQQACRAFISDLPGGCG
jgi:hypothetical protein